MADVTDHLLTLSMHERLRACGTLLAEAKYFARSEMHERALEYVRALEHVLTVTLAEVTAIRETYEAGQIEDSRLQTGDQAT